MNITISPEYLASGLRHNWQTLRRGFWLFCALSSGAWFFLYSIQVKFPYIRNGATVITEAKIDYLFSRDVFSSTAGTRVLVFGYSKILAGFEPSVFDATLGPSVESFNAARPGDGNFVYFLKRILERGTRPTHVLVPHIATDDRETSWIDYLQHDKLLVDRLFPFRTLPRDLVLFLATSARAGIAKSYAENAESVAKVIADRGYYFIKGQSHYAEDRLPDDFRIPSDHPNRAATRPLDLGGPAFQELTRLAAAYRFDVVFIPDTYREGEVAPPDSAATRDIRPLAGTPGFFVAGPVVWLMAPRYFSDPVHLNKQGAALYSRRLAELLAPLLGHRT